MFVLVLGLRPRCAGLPDRRSSLATSVGVVWHDEGAWVHNARNKAIFGSWRVDEWNPLFIAPVFTGLEYLSFEMFGVGLRQARLVSEIAGVRRCCCSVSVSGVSPAISPGCWRAVCSRPTTST